MRSLTLTLFALALVATLTLAPAHAQEPAPLPAVADTTAPATPEGQPAAPDRVSPVVPEPSGVALPAVVLPPEPSIWSKILGEVLPPILGALGTAISVLLTWLLALFVKKTGIAINIAKDSQIRAIIRSVIRGIDERAAAAAKVGSPWESMGKLKEAVKIAKALLPKLLSTEIERYIHEELAAMQGAGATGDAVG